MISKQQLYANWSYGLQLLVTAGLVFLANRIGYLFTSETETAALIWPQSGVSLAAVLLLGYRIWPAIGLGALCAYLSESTPIGFTISATIGNTLEPLVGAFLLHRVMGFRIQIERSRDVLNLVLCGAILSPMVSSTLGVTALCATGMQPWAQYISSWVTWWLGDAFGIIVVTPLLIKWFRRPLPSLRGRNAAEVVLLAVLLGFANILAFGDLDILRGLDYSLAFLVVPLLLWAALRFGMHGATLGSALTALFAVIRTAQGVGPFTYQTQIADMAMVWVYLIVITLTTMVLGATVVDREKAFQSLDSGIKSASRIQLGMLPDSDKLERIERESGLQIAYQYDPSQRVGGDVFGVELVSKNEVCIFFADVSGHGLEASMAAVGLHTFIQTTLFSTTAPHSVAYAVNKYCCEEFPEEKYATFVYLQFQPFQQTIKVVVAGHPPLMLQKADGSIQQIESILPPMGLFSDAVDEFSPATVELGLTDKLVVYSDGVIEEKNPAGEMFAEKNLERVLQSIAGAETKDIPLKIIGAVYNWRATESLSQDDITVVALGMAGWLYEDLGHRTREIS